VAAQADGPPSLNCTAQRAGNCANRRGAQRGPRDAILAASRPARDAGPGTPRRHRSSARDDDLQDGPVMNIEDPDPRPPTPVPGEPRSRPVTRRQAPAHAWPRVRSRETAPRRRGQARETPRPGRDRSRAGRGREPPPWVVGVGPASTALGAGRRRAPRHALALTAARPARPRGLPGPGQFPVHGLAGAERVGRRGCGSGEEYTVDFIEPPPDLDRAGRLQGGLRESSSHQTSPARHDRAAWIAPRAAAARNFPSRSVDLLRETDAPPAAAPPRCSRVAGRDPPGVTVIGNGTRSGRARGDRHGLHTTRLDPARARREAGPGRS